MSASFRYGYKKVYIKALDSMIEDNKVDIIFCINGVPTLKSIRSVIDNKKPNKTILSWVIGGYDERKVEELTKDTSIAVFTHPERAFKALALCMEYKNIAKILEKAPELVEIDKKEISKILKKAEQKGYDYLFSDAFDIIRHTYISLPKTIVIHNIEEIRREIFKKIKPPVCIKFEVKGGLHKQKMGLIKLGIMNIKELLEAYKEILNNISQQDIRAIIIQEMVSQGIELFIGMKRDPKFGSIMMIGKGGIDVEVYNDIEVIKIPFNRDQAVYAFRKTKIAKLVEKKHLKKLVDIMIKISTLCTQFPIIREIDLNPVILNQKGIWIVDAKIII